MNFMSGVLPFVGQLLLLAVLFTLVTGRLLKNRRQHLLIIAVLLVTGLFLPLNGLSLAQWLRSVVGDLSVLTMVIFLNILAQRLFGHGLLQSATRKQLLQGVSLAGVLFYPFALGLSAFDPYQLGYSPLVLPVLLCLASVVAWLKTRSGIAMILLLPVIGFNLHLLESTNLWDYLLDPIVLAYALVQVLTDNRFIRSSKSVEAGLEPR